MTERKYRTYTEEFKLEALELLKEREKSAAEIEQELGITPGLLYKWRARYQIHEHEEQGKQLIPSDIEEAKAEIRRLKKELAEVEEEREILKKVLNIFSRTDK